MQLKEIKIIHVNSTFMARVLLTYVLTYFTMKKAEISHIDETHSGDFLIINHTIYFVEKMPYELNSPLFSLHCSYVLM